MATITPNQDDLPVGRRRRAEADWSFVSTPKWILSHLFAATMIGLFIFAMFWQIGRRAERVELNELVAARADSAPLTIDEAVGAGSPESLDYRRVLDRGRWIDPEVVRVSNRTSNGVAGQWVVGLFQTVDGPTVLVNRGFVALAGVADPPESDELSGWLRPSVERQGLAVEDVGEGLLVNRLNVEDIALRFTPEQVEAGPLAPMYVQLEGPFDGIYPQPVPLPEQTNGPHFSYAVQWAIFAFLGTLVYGLLLRRIATTPRR